MSLLRNKEEIDEIMEEMELKTPRSSVTLSFSTPKAESLRVADAVDARPTSTDPPQKFSFFSTIFEKKMTKPGLKYPSRPTNERYYDYTNDNLGVAVIFNQVKFKDEQERKGSEKDAKDFERVLLNLGFNVHVFNDYTTQQIKDVLSALSKLDHTDNDCLLISIMTHGEKEGKIYSSDGKMTVNELWENFVGTNCETLIGKPKLFFIQACRGTMTDPGILLEPKPRARLMAPMDMVDAKVMNNEPFFVIPTLADLLVMYSTSEGYYSFRNPEDGSWFIQALCEELRENPHEEIMTILTGVNRRVAFAKQSYVPHKSELDASKQMPIIQSMLTKSLYLLDKERKGKMRLNRLV